MEFKDIEPYIKQLSEQGKTDLLDYVMDMPIPELALDAHTQSAGSQLPIMELATLDPSKYDEYIANDG